MNLVLKNHMHLLYETCKDTSVYLSSTVRPVFNSGQAGHGFELQVDLFRSDQQPTPVLKGYEYCLIQSDSPSTLLRLESALPSFLSLDGRA